MKFSAAAVLAAAVAGAAAGYTNVTYTTEVVSEVVTYCPTPTKVTYGGETYTVTEPTTLTITKCPGGCTVSYPVHTISSVYCNTCSTPGYSNSTAAAPTGGYPTGVPSYTPVEPSESAIATAGAGHAAALSGAGLAGVLGFAALLL